MAGPFNQHQLLFLERLVETLFDGFAAKLYATARLGDRVIVTDGATLKMGQPII